MNLLLDTHALLWWLAGDHSLSATARSAIDSAGNSIHVSAASVWEITTKFRLGKLPGAERVAQEAPGVIARQGFTGLPVTVAHGQAAGGAPRSAQGPVRPYADRAGDARRHDPGIE